MRTECSVDQVRIAALHVMGIDMGDLASRAKTPPFVNRAREGVAGAMYDLSEYQPSLPELSKRLGKRHHTTVIGQLARYHRDWPPAIRRLWEQAVLKELEATADHSEAP